MADPCYWAEKAASILAYYEYLRDDCHCGDGAGLDPEDPCYWEFPAITETCLFPLVKTIWEKVSALGTFVTTPSGTPTVPDIDNPNCWTLTQNNPQYWAYVKNPSNVDCVHIDHDIGLPVAAPPGSGLDDGDYLGIFELFLSDLTCAENEYSLNLTDQFPTTMAPAGGCESPCSDSVKYGQDVCFGPYCYDVIVYTDGAITVDDDLWINGSVIEDGDHLPTVPDPPCPTCNAAHDLDYTEASPMATIEAGTELCINILDQQGTDIGAEGVLLWKRLDP